MWWGYLHANGSIILKRWFGDHKDYTSDCQGNCFVQEVVEPFEASDRQKALEYIIDALIDRGYGMECTFFKDREEGV